MTDIKCGVTGKQYVVSDSESKDLVDQWQTFTAEYFNSRATNGKVAKDDVIEVYEGLLKASVEKGLMKQEEVDDFLKNKSVLAETVDELDLNSDGFFDLEEFKSLSVKYESKYAEITMKEFDLDGDGFITREEADTVLGRMAGHPNEANLTLMFKFIFDNFDTDGDGKISLPEFYNASKNMKW
eukprot:TRINITY_DN15418_c0_g1_i1.p1 TRINITY_DN15418_c0_g1~~TRINITY_DN15418_c0_g1_i1.p1  ORF type:complete len:183 (+),score=33.15 TRINITY_DN15418_c0_g1_i1:1-549(+)